MIGFRSSIAYDTQSYIKVITSSPLTYLAPVKSCESEICLELINLIEDAEDTIDFAVYGLREQEEVLNALINAQKRGVKVRGVIDKDIFNTIILYLIFISEIFCKVVKF